MPESFQNGEKGEKAQSAIDEIENAILNSETIQIELDNAISSLENAVE